MLFTKVLIFFKNTPILLSSVSLNGENTPPEATTTMPLSSTSSEEALEAMRSARERARQRIAQGPEGITYDVRIALLESHNGFGYLLHKLVTFEHIDPGLLTLLNFVDIEYIWQLCTRKRSELAALEGAAWDGPLLDNDELNQIEQLLAQFDLDLVPE